MLFTVDQAKQSLELLGISATHENIRKWVRAKYLVDHEHIKLLQALSTQTERVYQVASQWDPSTIYTVLQNGNVKCDCPDDAEHCKHGLSVLLQEEQEREEAWISKMEGYEADRFACYPEQFELR
jgi:uncharacterized Zn finger protein